MTADALPRHATPDLDVPALVTTARSTGPRRPARQRPTPEQLAAAVGEVRRTRGALRSAVEGARAAAVVGRATRYMLTSHWQGRRSGRGPRYFAGLLSAAINEHTEAVRRLARIERCGARCRDGHGCHAPRVEGKRRCKLHGGRSTGPTTAEGRERAAAALAKINAARRSTTRPAARSPGLLETARSVLAATLAASARPRRKTRTSTWSPASDGHHGDAKHMHERVQKRLQLELAALRAEMARRGLQDITTTAP